MNNDTRKSPNAQTPPQLCSALLHELCQLAIVTEQQLSELRGADGRARTEWLQTFGARWLDRLHNCDVFAQGLAANKIDNRALDELLAEARGAFAAPSLQVEAPTLAAVSLLLERSVTLLGALFGFATELAKQQQLDALAALGQLFERPFVSLPVGRVPQSPAAYRQSLRPFSYYAARPDLLEGLRLGEIDASKQPLTAELQSLLSPPGTPKSAPAIVTAAAPQPYGRAVAAGPSPTLALQFSTPMLRPELLAAVDEPRDRTFRVWYGTDRVPLRPDDPALGFSAIMDDQLHFGSSLVFVPRSHDVGSIGSSWVRRTFLKRDDDRLQLTLIKPLRRDGFQKAVADALDAGREQRRALIFLHGFRVSFEEAALRAAQLACDLGVEGITAFYSWASAGRLGAYAQDEETVRLTVDHFLEFIDTLLAINSLEGVDIIAHSMGNRLLAAAVARLADARGHSRIGHLILAAPDISRSEFNKVATQYGTVASKRATLYSCAKDKALAVSTKLHNYLRIGYEPPVYCTAGIDTISASQLRLDLLGHGYIASVRPVIADLKNLLSSNLAPAQRNLDPVPETGAAEYWLLRDG